MKKKSSNTRKLNRALIILTCGFMCYTLVNIIDTQIKIKEKNKNIESISAQIVEQKAINNELNETLDEGVTSEAISKVAKEKLGLAVPGERIIVDIGSK